MRRCRTRSRRNAIALGLAAGLLPLVLAGCVSEGTYDEVKTQRDLLRDENDRLHTSVKNLEDERARIAAELDDIRTDRDVLKQQSDKLSKRSQELEQKVPELEKCATDTESLNTNYETLLNDLSGQVSARDSEIERLRQCCAEQPKKKSPAGTKSTKPKSSATQTPAPAR